MKGIYALLLVLIIVLAPFGVIGENALYNVTRDTASGVSSSGAPSGCDNGTSNDLPNDSIRPIDNDTTDNSSNSSNGVDDAKLEGNETVNEGPSASIISPTEGEVFRQGESITFTGSGTDPEDGGLNGSALQWTSNRDGEIGYGCSFTISNLSIGNHTITLTATDSGELHGSAWVNISITREVPLFRPRGFGYGGGTTIYVNETGWWREGGDFNQSTTPIQHAIDNATAGDTIIVKDGTYTENVDVTVDNLSIRSENGSASTVVQAASSNDHVFEVTADYVNISGFTVKGATSTDMAGIYHGGLLFGSNSNISDNVVTENYDGIYLNSSSSNTIVNNNASNNSNVGIYLWHSSNNNLASNTANSNAWDGIDLNDSGNNTLTNNNANMNTYYGISLNNSNNNTIADNNASSNSYEGIYLYYSSNNTLNNNTAKSNLWYGISLASSGNNTLTNNTANSNGIGIYLYDSSNNTLSNNTMNLNGLFVNSSYNNIVLNNTVNTKLLVYLENVNNYVVSNAGQVIAVNSNNITVANLNLSYASVGIRLLNTNDSFIANNTANSNRYGIHLTYSCNNTLINNTANSSTRNGIRLSSSNNNTIYNNYFNNTNNAYEDGYNLWNITAVNGTNIIGGPNLGGNYWSDYTGSDNNSDGFGDTLIPYNSSGNITNGGDWLPLVKVPSYMQTVALVFNNPASPSTRELAVYSKLEAFDDLIITNISSSSATYATLSSYNLMVITDYYANISGSDINRLIDEGKKVLLLYDAGEVLGGTWGAGSVSSYYSLVVESSTAFLSSYDAGSTIPVQSSGSAYYITASYPANWTVIGRNSASTNYKTALYRTNETGRGAIFTYDPVYYTSDGTEVFNKAVDWLTRIPVHNLNTSENFSTIQAAIYASNTTDGHIIEVDPGTYTENVKVNKSLTIRSTSGNPADTIVQANNSNDHVFEATADWVNISGFTVKNATDLNKAGIYLYNVEHCNISNNNVTNNWRGIFLYSSSNSNITNNIANNNTDSGISLSGSSNIICNNIASGNGDFGISLGGSNNILMNNTASNNTRGIMLDKNSNYNKLTNNSIHNNTIGLYLLLNSSFNTITGNNVSSSTNVGIRLQDSNTTNNLLYNNYFNNTNNAYDDGNNTWNISKTLGTNIVGGLYLGGNYWSDYEGSDTDGDGLGETSYNISGDSNKDYHPVVTPTLISITLSNYTVQYGTLGAGESNTSSIIYATNNGTVNETFYIRGDDAYYGPFTWVLAESIGNNTYMHEFNNGSSWLCLNKTDKTLAANVPIDGNATFTLRITLPSFISAHGEYTTIVTIMATEA